MTDTVTAVEREKRELGSSSSVSSKNLTAVPFPFTVPFLLSQSGGGRVVSRGAAAWLLHPSWGRGGRRRLFRLLEKSTGFEGVHKKFKFLQWHTPMGRVEYGVVLFYTLKPYAMVFYPVNDAGS